MNYSYVLLSENACGNTTRAESAPLLIGALCGWSTMKGV